MTKYILHGGAWQKTAKYQDYFSEMTKGLIDPVNILCVYFARDNKEWEQCFLEDRQKFIATSAQKDLRFDMASNRKAKFIEQIKNANVIYLRGGKTAKLQKQLEIIPNIDELWQGKVISGSSAGALVLSRYYYENDDNVFTMGLGILPIKVYCHYTDSGKDNLNNLKKYGEDLKVYSIAEEEYIVIKQ